MRYLFLKFLAVTAVCVPLAVATQSAMALPLDKQDGLGDEFKAMHSEIDVAKASAKGGISPAAVQAATAANPAAATVAANPLAAAPVAANPLTTAAANPLTAAKAETQQTNPLGAAANLPVSGTLPATADALALGMQTPEEVQAQMELDTEEQKKKLEKQTFEEALKMLLPLSPEQIIKVLDNFKQSREASETPIATPSPKIEVQTVSLDPSQEPPTIKTSPGRVTTLTILDATGAPWPIQDVSWGGKFEITPPEEGGHIVRITPMTAHGAGNISIRLVDLITPVTFSIQTGLDEVHYRFDARIPKNGPLAKTPLIEYGGLNTVAGGDENLVQMLDGTPPGSAEKLVVEGTDGRTSAWRASGHIYLRTPLTLLSPAWDSSVSSADGTNVYTMNDTPVILLSDQGKMVRAHIATDEVSP
jgi:intracellular multiplication protein IcmK